MAYFTTNMENIKLTVLYMLKSLNIKVTAPQLTTAVIEALGLSYFDVQLAISELEDKGYMASLDGTRGALYSITPSGEELLSVMLKNMPRSLRLSCDDYARDEREKIINMGYFSAKSNKNPSGGYDVVLTSVENDKIVLSVMLNVADNEMAENMCSAWEAHSGEVYDAIFRILAEEK